MVPFPETKIMGVLDLTHMMKVIQANLSSRRKGRPRGTGQRRGAPDHGFGSTSALLIAWRQLFGNIASNINMSFGLTLTHLFRSFTVSTLAVWVRSVAFAPSVHVTATDSRGAFCIDFPVF